MARGGVVETPPPMGHMSKVSPTFEEHFADRVNVFGLGVKVAQEQARVRREGFEFGAGDVHEGVRARSGAAVRMSVRPAVGVYDVDSAGPI